MINKRRLFPEDLDAFHRVPHEILTQTVLSEPRLRLMLLVALPNFLRLLDYLGRNRLEHLVAELHGAN